MPVQTPGRTITLPRLNVENEYITIEPFTPKGKALVARHMVNNAGKYYPIAECRSPENARMIAKALNACRFD